MSLELSGTTGVKGVAGSVAAPSIVGDDTNTGISFPAADTIKFSTGGVERMSITNSGVTGTGVGGKVLQIKHVNDTSSSTFGSNVSGSSGYTDMGSLSVNITPASTNSNILILSHVCAGQDRNDLFTAIFFRIMRDSTPIQGTITGTQFPAAFCITPQETYGQDGMFSGDFSYVDSPNTTSQVTYKVQGSNRSTIAWSYNRGYRTFGGEGKGVSNLTLVEYTP